MSNKEYYNMVIAHILGKSSNGQREIKKLIACQKDDGHTIKIYPRFFSLYLYILSKLLRRKIDILHIHGYSSTWGFYKKYLGRMDSVTTLQSICNIRGPDKKRNDVKIPVSDNVIVCDLDTYNKYKTIFPNFEYSIVVPGYDVDAVNVRPTRQLSINNNILGYGPINESSRLHLLIETLRYLPKNYFLKWVGKIESEAYFQDLIELSKNLGVENQVEMIIEEDLKIEYDIVFYDISIYLDLNSDAGYETVIESMIRGIPSLVYKKDSLYDLQGLVYITSIAPKTLAKEIKKQVDIDVDIPIEEVKEAFSWESKCREIMDVYHSSMKDYESITTDKQKAR